MSGADVVVLALVHQGVDTVFAYPGGQSMPLHQALTRFRRRIRTVLPRHEQGGGFAAQGYARSTGKPGVCMATSGPGATNLVTASAGLGTMGFGLPAAMGAKIANPDALVIDIDGDGSLLMNIQEMATCYCEKVPVKVLLLNNQHLGMVVQWEDRFFGSNRAHTYLGPIDRPEAVGLGNGSVPEDRYPDFAAIARGFGWEARHVAQTPDLTDALADMIDSPGSYLLDVDVPYEEHVLPMIPSGMTVRELIKE